MLGKTVQHEDFPVAGLLLPQRWRAPVLAFYDFARTADDIADSPELDSATKLARLDALTQALTAPEDTTSCPQAVAALRHHLAAQGLDTHHARDLLEAFRRDAENRPIEHWNDLLDYCRLSAAPVGRFLLALARITDPAALAAADALCAALQITNHIKDCRHDYLNLQRLYVPRRWLDDAKVPPHALAKGAAVGQVRALLDRMLDGVDHLLTQAAPLPRLLRHSGLAWQAALTLACGHRLAYRLRHHDPLAEDLSLNTSDKLLCVGKGLACLLVGDK